MIEFLITIVIVPICIWLIGLPVALFGQLFVLQQKFEDWKLKRRLKIIPKSLIWPYYFYKFLKLQLDEMNNNK